MVQSFNEAKRILIENRFFDKKYTVLWYDTGKSGSSSTYYYPIELEMKLMNFVKGGDMERVQKLLNEIFVENFVRRDLPPFMKDQFIYELKSTMIKLLDQVKLDEKETCQFIEKRFDELDTCQTTEQVYEVLIGFYREICDIVNSIKKSHNTDLIMKIIKYVRMNFANPDLGLGSIADQFNMTEVYLSQFFKEQTGENFSAYLERIRMECADRLLAEANIRIDEVARRTGYNSANTFRRAYKRYYGIRPSERKRIFEREVDEKEIYKE